MRKLKIDQILFFNHAFSIDVGFQPYPDEAYLCKKTGEVLFLPDEMSDYSCDENHEAVKKNPNQYLQIPGKSHGEHHEILKDFLNSIEKSDSFSESKIKGANEAYYTASHLSHEFGKRKSIGSWKNRVSEEMYDAYSDFREKVLETEGEEWLRKNGIEVEWS